MLTDLWASFLALPQWQQAGGTAGALIAVWLVGRSASSVLRRPRDHTEYILREHRNITAEEAGTSARTVGEAPPALSNGASAESRESPTQDADATAAPADSSDAAPSAAAPGTDADADEPANPDWADNRPLCPCCGYPTATDEFNAICVLCDWGEQELETSPLEGFSFRHPPYGLVPSLPIIQAGVGFEERERELVLAKQNFAKYGSALAPGDRTADDYPLDAGRVEARRELRDLFEYLKTDPPDDSETWDKIDPLITSLRERNE